MGRLPLALTLAGGYLAHQVIDPWSMAEYGRALDRGTEADAIDLLDQGAEYGGGQDSRHLASSTWELSLDALRAHGLPEATALIRLLACWSDDPLPLHLLAGAGIGTVLPRARVETALRGLLDHSLTRLVPGPPRCVRTHGVLLDSIARSTPAGDRGPLVGAAAELLRTALPEVTRPWTREDPPLAPFAPHVRALLRRASQWTEVTPAAVACVLDCTLRLVVALHRAGDYASALSVAEDAVARGTRPPDASHPALLAIRQRIGRALYRLGRYEEAETTHRRALADCTTAFGADAVETLESHVGLSAVLFWGFDRKAEALALLRRAVEGRTAALGAAHPSTLIARIYLLEFTDGPELDLEPDPDTGPALLEDCRSTVGPGHPITLAAELNYGYALIVSGHQPQALPLVRGTVAAFEDTHGPDHPKTLAARSLLSRVLGELGLHEEAVAQAQQVADTRARVLGPDHPWTAWSLERLEARLRASRQDVDGGPVVDP